MTDAENALWAKLSGKQFNGLVFRRKRNIGNYIVDFLLSGCENHHYTRWRPDFPPFRKAGNVL